MKIGPFFGGRKGGERGSVYPWGGPFGRRAVWAPDIWVPFLPPDIWVLGAMLDARFLFPTRSFPRRFFPRQLFPRRLLFFELWKKNNEAGNSLNAVEREPVPTRVLNTIASKASYKPKQRSYRKAKLIFFFMGFYPGTISSVLWHAGPEDIAIVFKFLN